MPVARCGKEAKVNYTTTLVELTERALAAIAGFRLHAAFSRYGPANQKAFGDRSDYAVEKLYRDAIAERAGLRDIRVIFEDNDAVPIPPEQAQALPDDCLLIDPVDGTRALRTGSGRGIGSSVALRLDGRMVAGFIGDAITGEIIGFGPEQDYVLYMIRGEKGHRAFQFEDPPEPLMRGQVLLRRAPSHHSRFIAKMTDNPAEGALFRGIQVEDGSCALSFVRLWRREVGAMVLPKKPDTPWDSAAVYPICERLGYIAIRVDRYTGELEQVPLVVPGSVTLPRTERLILHESLLPGLLDWQDRTYGGSSSNGK